MGFKLTTDAGDPIEHYSAVFRELFCVAAAEIAEDIQFPLHNLGVLFDDVVPTG